MKADNQKPWILAGYELFAKEGPQALKVEVISRIVQKSKSSFYHHFADLEVFTELLLSHHLQQARILADKERACERVVPDLLHILVAHKQDLLFNRQLRFNREVPAFRSCFEQVNAEVGTAIVDIWAESLGLEERSHLALLVLNLSMENFFLQITEESLNYEWLEAYIKEIRFMVSQFQNSPTT